MTATIIHYKISKFVLLKRARPLLLLVAISVLAAPILKAAEYIYQGPLPTNFTTRDGVADLAFALKHPKSNYIRWPTEFRQHRITNWIVTAKIDISVSLIPGGLYYLDIGWRPSDTNIVPNIIVPNRQVVLDQYGRLINAAPWSSFERLKQSTFADVILYLAGMVCMIVYAFEKFNTPPSRRSTTTRGRYYTAVVAYAACGLFFYLLFVSTPELFAAVVKSEPKDLPAWATGLATPLFIAVLLTVFLPKIPPLAFLDEKVRKWLLEIAAIPRAAWDLSRDLQKKFEPTEERKKLVERELKINGLDQEYLIWDEPLVMDEATKLKFTFTRVAALIEGMKKEDKEKRFSAFLNAYSQEKIALFGRYQAVCKQADAYFTGLRTGGSAMIGTRWGDHLAEQYKSSCEALAEDAFLFLSRALLRCTSTHEDRRKWAAEFGFKIPGEKRSLTFNDLMFLFLVISIVMGVALTLTTGVLNAGGAISKAGLGQNLQKSVMISMIYCLAVACAIYPKERWESWRAEGQEFIRGRKWMPYAVSGLFAAIGCYCISAICHFLFSLGSLEEVVESVMKKYPYCLIAASSGFLTAYCADNHAKDSSSARRLQWLEAAVQLAAGLVLGWIVHYWLTQTLYPKPPPPLPVLMTTFALVGALIGYFVPSWYREGSAED